MTLNTRLTGLNFSKLWGKTAYTAEALSAEKPNERESQLFEDKTNLDNLNKDCNEHDAVFEHRFAQYNGMASTMAKTFKWTGKELISPGIRAPKELLDELGFEINDGADGSGENDGAGENPDDSPPFFSNPYADDNFSGQHANLHDEFAAARKACTPDDGADSFNAYYAGKNWGQRWQDFRTQYAGKDGEEGEFRNNVNVLLNARENIEFGTGWLESREGWCPGLEDLGPPRPIVEDCAQGWRSFVSTCEKIWTSPILKPELPTWSSAGFDAARATLKENLGTKCLDYFKDWSRPKCEDWIDEPWGHKSGRNSCFYMLRNGSRYVGRGFLKVVSVGAWGLQLLFKNFVANGLILAANILYNAVSGLLWVLSLVAQAGVKLANFVWQAAKLLLFYPASKLVGLVGSVLAYSLAGVGYGITMAIAWTLKLVFQFVRCVLHNTLTLIWNLIGRPIAWGLAHIVLAAGMFVSTIYTTVKAFVHGIYTAGANFCSYVGGRIYYQFLRPVASWVAKAVLGFVQGTCHVGLAAGQLVYMFGKGAWHFVGRHIWRGIKLIVENLVKFVKWAGKTISHILKLGWNYVLLPVAYYLLWTPLKIIAKSALLLIFGAVQSVLYPVILLTGGLGIGAVWSAAEFGLFVRKHWISKAFYPVPIAAIGRSLEAADLQPGALGTV